MKTLIALMAATAVLTVAGAASAHDARVRYGDLDLASPEGAAQFDRRVERAARSACSGSSGLAPNACAARFRREVHGLLPVARQDEYARGHATRQLAMIPIHYG